MQNDKDCNHIIGLDCDYEGGIPRNLSAGFPSGRAINFFEYYNYCPECGTKNLSLNPKPDEQPE